MQALKRNAAALGLAGGIILVLGGGGIPNEFENGSLCETGPGYFDYGPHRDDAEAEQLAMHVSGQLRAPDDEYDRILRDLQAIRDTYPVLSTVVDDPDYRADRLIVRLPSPEPWVGYDDLNTFYQVVDDLVIFESLGIHRLTFCDNLNAWALAPEYAALPEVLYAEPDLAFGVEDTITIEVLGGTYRYTIVDGFHDCFDGCDCDRTWVLDVDIDGAVTLLSYVQDDHGWSWCIFDDTACCMSDDTCNVWPITPCLLSNGTPLAFGTPCESGGTSACAAGTAIPAVSEWGMVAMMLLVLTAGTLVCTRRRVPSA